jgi:hypothetical protein
MTLVGLWHTAVAQDVLTQRNNNMRTGTTSWPGLNQISVKSFRLLASLPVDAPILAQPLFLKSVDFRGTRRSMVWVATVTNKLYPFNADPPFDQLAPAIDLGPPYKPSAADRACCLINEALMMYVDGQPLIGIESTPVIDRGHNLMFVSYRGQGRLAGEQRLAAIELSSGKIWRTVAVPGSDVWHKIHRNRLSLLLDRGIVFVGFSAVNEDPRKLDYAKSFQGWIHAFDAATLIYLGAWRSVRDPNNHGDPLDDSFDGGGLWQASTGLAADGQGNLFFSTGNGAKNPQPPDSPGLNLSNAIVRLQVERVPVRAPNAAGNPATLVSSHQQHMFYPAQDGSIQHIFWTDYEPPGQLRHDNWTQKAGIPPAAAGAPATLIYGDQQHVFYRAHDGTIRHLFWGPDAPQNTVWADNWSQKAHNPPAAAGDPATMVYGNQQHVFYRAADGTIRHLFWAPDAPPNTVWADNWTQKAHNPPAAAGDPATMVYGNQQHVFYRATDGTIRHLFWAPDAPANTVWADNWSQKGGNPPAAAGDPATMVYGNQQHVFYRATDGTIRHLFWGPDAPANSVWADNWTQKANNPPAAAGDPATMVYGNQQHVFYRATDGTIRHLFWGPDAPANTVWADDWTHLPDRASMEAADWFVSYRKLWQDHSDMDLGAGGVVLIPGTSFLVQGGKEGILYLLDRTNMGKFDGTPLVGHVPARRMTILLAITWRRRSRRRSTATSARDFYVLAADRPTIPAIGLSGPTFTERRSSPISEADKPFSICGRRRTF